MTIGDDGIASKDNTGASWQKKPVRHSYRPCIMYEERKFHDWRWLGWPLSFNAVQDDLKWCHECWLLKRMVNGRWGEAGYREPLTVKHKPDCEALCRGEASCDCGAISLSAASKEPRIRTATIRICQSCVDLVGEECHTPECVFCFRSVTEAKWLMDKMLIAPIIDGERLVLVDEETPIPRGVAPCRCGSLPEVKYQTSVAGFGSEHADDHCPNGSWVVRCTSNAHSLEYYGLTRDDAIECWNSKQIEVEPYPFGRVGRFGDDFDQ